MSSENLSKEIYKMIDEERSFAFLMREVRETKYMRM